MMDFIAYILIQLGETGLILVGALLILVILEVTLRLIKNTRSKSLFRIIPKVIFWIAKLSNKLAIFLDKVVTDKQPNPFLGEHRK